jgi:ribosomal-protein-alanine N-acetyltransferase
VREQNRAAQQLYQRQGFRPVGLRSRYYRNPVEDAIVLRRELSGGA